MYSRFYVYWIQSGQRAYVGATVDPCRRLRQHNGEIAGGALRTRNRGPWHFECVIHGFRTWKETLQYEWAAKYYCRRCRSIKSRYEALDALNCRDRWTSNSPPSQDIPLVMERKPTMYGLPPESYVHVPRLPLGHKKRCRNNKFKAKMHGIR